MRHRVLLVQLKFHRVRCDTEMHGRFLLAILQSNVNMLLVTCLDRWRRRRPGRTSETRRSRFRRWLRSVHCAEDVRERDMFDSPAGRWNGDGRL